MYITLLRNVPQNGKTKKDYISFVLNFTKDVHHFKAHFPLWYLNYQITIQLYQYVLLPLDFSDSTYSYKYLTWSFFFQCRHWLFTYVNTYYFIMNYSLFIFSFIIQFWHYIDFVEISIWVIYIIYDFHFRIVRDNKNLYLKNVSWVW